MLFFITLTMLPLMNFTARASNATEKCEFVQEAQKIICCTNDIPSECFEELEANREQLEHTNKVEEFEDEPDEGYEPIVIGICVALGVVLLCCCFLICYH